MAQELRVQDGSATGPPPAPRSAQRGDIQGMRAVAVLLVLLSHAGISGVAGGYVGVDVFFVISGFLITGIMVREVGRTGRVSILEFYARRARRILPAATVTLVAIAMLSGLVYTTGNLRLVLGDVVWATFFAENIHLARAGTGYFTQDSFVSPVRHFWSLAVEEQFYLVWPAVLGLVAVLVARRVGSAEGRARVFTRCSGAVVAVAVVASLAWSVWRTEVDPQMAYYSTFTRTWELGLGALLALGAPAVRRWPAAVQLLAGWAGLAAIVVAGVTYDEATPFPGHHAALPVVGAALVLAAGVDGPRWGPRVLLDTAPMRFVGDISYSLYLWHWPLLVLAPVWRGHEISLRGRVLLMVLSVGVAWLSHRFVESPLRHVGSRRRGRALLMWPVAVSVALVGVLGVGVADARVQASRAADQEQQFERAAPGPGGDALVEDVRVSARLARADAPLPSPLHPALPDLFDDITRVPQQCVATQRPQVSHRLCSFGDVTSDRVVVAWGDSHMGVWWDVLDRFAKERRLRIVPFAKASCPAADVQQSYRGQAYPECARYRDWVVQQVGRIQPAYVVMGSAISVTVLDPATGRPAVADRADRLFADGARRLVARLHAGSPRSTLQTLSDVQLLSRDARSCLGSRSATRATCSQPLHPTIRARNAALRAASESVGGRFVDLTPYLCADGVCPLVIRDRIVYRDWDHLTTTYVDHLSDRVRTALAW